MADDPNEVTDGAFPIRIFLLSKGECGIERLLRPVGIQLT